MGAGVCSLYREIHFIEVGMYVAFIGEKGTVSTFLNNVFLNTNDIIFYTQKITNISYEKVKSCLVGKMTYHIVLKHYLCMYN